MLVLLSYIHWIWSRLVFRFVLLLLVKVQRQTTGVLKYKGPWDCFKTICREKGAAGLYRLGIFTLNNLEAYSLT